MPTHSPEDLDSYYSGEFRGESAVAIMFYEPENDGFSFDPDATGEPYVEETPLFTGGWDELSWGDPASNREVAKLVLRHHLNREPDQDELATFLEGVEIEGGLPWQVKSGDLDNQGLER